MQETKPFVIRPQVRGSFIRQQTDKLKCPFETLDILVEAHQKYFQNTYHPSIFLQDFGPACHHIFGNDHAALERGFGFVMQIYESICGGRTACYSIGSSHVDADAAFTNAGIYALLRSFRIDEERTTSSVQELIKTPRLKVYWWDHAIDSFIWGRDKLHELVGSEYAIEKLNAIPEPMHCDDGPDRAKIHLRTPEGEKIIFAKYYPESEIFGARLAALGGIPICRMVDCEKMLLIDSAPGTSKNSNPSHSLTLGRIAAFAYVFHADLPFIFFAEDGTVTPIDTEKLFGKSSTYLTPEECAKQVLNHAQNPFGADIRKGIHDFRQSLLDKIEIVKEMFHEAIKKRLRFDDTRYMRLRDLCEQQSTKYAVTEEDMNGALDRLRDHNAPY